MKSMERRHALLMLLCLLVPLGALGIALVTGAPFSRGLGLGALLLCLSAHLLMMLWMHRTDHAQEEAFHELQQRRQNGDFPFLDPPGADPSGQSPWAVPTERDR